MSTSIRVCYFGSYSLKNHDFPRNYILQKSLKSVGVEIVQCQCDENIIKRSRTLIRKFLDKKPYDVIIVGVMGHYDVWLAKILGTIFKVPIIFDMYTSLYDTDVFDRDKVKKISFKAIQRWLVDKLACELADVVLLDTNANISYISKLLKVNRNKFKCLYVGTDIEVFKCSNKSKRNNRFIVQYHGHFIPLHGIEKIVKAAELLKNESIHFRLIGSGQLYSKIKNHVDNRRLNNVEFLPSQTYEKLAELSREASIILAGPFGNSTKAKSVIPNKVYESIALGIPTIVGDTPAIKEIFNNNHCIIVDSNEVNAIASKVKWVMNNYKESQCIANNGAEYISTLFSHREIGERLLSILRLSKIIS